MKLDKAQIASITRFKNKFCLNQSTAKPQIANKLRKQLSESIHRSSTITDGYIQKQLSEGEELRALITSVQLDNDYLLNRYCHKTGKLIGAGSLEEIQGLVIIHGEQKAKQIQKIQASNYTAATWLCTDAQALTKLAKLDPIGYFIYSAGLIWSLESIKKSGSKNTLDHFFNESVLSHLESTDNIHDSTSVRYACLIDRINANKNLVSLQQTNLHYIVRLNSLMRRAFGMLNPIDLLKFSKFRQLHCLSSITYSIETLQEFEAAIKSILSDLVKKKVQERIDKTDYRFISYAEVCALQQANGGLAQFRLQEKILAKTSVDPVIMQELRDFLVDLEFDALPSNKESILGDFELSNKQTSITPAEKQTKTTPVKMSLKFSTNAPTNKPSLASILKSGGKQK